MNNFKTKLDNYFQITERGSTVKTEVIAGLTTFFAMCYILAVNPGAIGGSPAIQNSVFIATAIGAIVGTLLMALYAKMPFAQAPGMGLNSFFFVIFMLPFILNGTFDFEKGYIMGLTIILLSGLLFLVLSLTGARKKIATALPDCLKKSISAGIGLFIAFIGLKNAGLITANQYTFVQLGNVAIFDVNSAVFHNWYAIAPVLVALFGFFLIAILSKFKVKGSIIISIVVSSILFYLCTWTLPVFDMGNIGQSFKDFGSLGLAGCFKGFKPLAATYTGFGGFLSVIMLIITFTLVDMFDTMGTLQGTAAQAGMLDDEGNPINLNKCLMCDSVATVVGAVAGTSTVTTYVESAAGVSAGGRTGLTALVVAGLFLIAMFLRPLFTIIPGVATAPALIWVGVLMLKNFKDVDMSDVSNAVPAFLTLIMMPLTYSISNGIAMGMISYTLIRIFTLKFQKKDILVAILGLLFAIRFFCIAM